MDWGFVSGLVVIASVLIGLIVYFGRKLSKHVQKQTPESEFAVNITPLGNALFGGMVGFWGACLLAWKFAPNSTMAELFSTPLGVVTTFGGSIVFVTVLGTILEKLGYPITRRGDRDT